MIGVVVVTHGELAQELLKTTESIVGSLENFEAVSVNAERDAEDERRTIEEAIRKVDQGDGVILLTDLFGGTPSNICLSFLKEMDVEVVSGVNLPMLIKLPSFMNNNNLEEAANLTMEYGKRNISVASRRLYTEEK